MGQMGPIRPYEAVPPGVVGGYAFGKVIVRSPFLFSTCILSACTGPGRERTWVTFEEE